MKKGLKVIVCIVMAFVLLRMFGTLIRSGAGSTAASTTETVSVQQDNSLPTITETVICDDETAKITIAGLVDNKMYDTYVVSVNIENKTEKTISYSIDWVNINGFTISALSFGDIYAGMNADADFGFDKDEVALAEINPITEINFSIELRDKDSDSVLSIVPAEIKTSAFGQATSEISFNGMEVYNNDGITIYVKPADNPTVKHPLIVYVINDSDRNIILSYDDIAFNDTMAMDYMSGPYVLAHTKRVAEMALTYFGDEPQIDKINSVTLSIDILPYREDGGFSTGDTIYTEPFTIQVG